MQSASQAVLRLGELNKDHAQIDLSHPLRHPRRTHRRKPEQDRETAPICPCAWLPIPPESSSMRQFKQFAGRHAGLVTCSAEDLVILKSFADRPQDWVDVERVIVRQTGKLDWKYILDQLKLLMEL